MTIDAPLDMRPAAVPLTAVNGLLVAPILPTLLKLAIHNTIAMFGTALAALGFFYRRQRQAVSAA